VLPSSEDQARRQPEAAPPPEVAAPEAIEATAPKAGTGEARHITVDTDHYTALFTTAGARLESLRLKQYRTTVDPNSPPQEAIVPARGGRCRSASNCVARARCRIGAPRTPSTAATSPYGRRER